MTTPNANWVTIAAAEAGFAEDLGERDVLARQQDEQVIEQVGRLASQGALVFAERGDNGLGRFFAELLCAPLRAAVEQLPGVGSARRLSAALLDDGGQPLQGVVGHGS